MTSMKLPHYSEVDVPELKLSATPLLASAIHLGKFCDNQCKEFMLCNYESHDPRKCLKEGKEVTSCAFDFFRAVKKNCATEFENYYTCLHKYGGADMSLHKCRKIQLPFDDCVKIKMGQERPPINYFNRVRLHETNRPRPTPGLAPMPSPLDDVPDFRAAPDPDNVGKRNLLEELFI